MAANPHQSKTVTFLLGDAPNQINAHCWFKRIAVVGDENLDYATWCNQSGTVDRRVECEGFQSADTAADALWPVLEPLQGTWVNFEYTSTGAGGETLTASGQCKVPMLTTFVDSDPTSRRTSLTLNFEIAEGVTLGYTPAP